MKYTDAKTQIVILGLICFFGPGMFNALNGMGGGGQLDQTVGNNANTALYITFMVFGLAGGTFINLLGIRPCMFIAALTYALYSASYIYFNASRNGALTIASGALLGAGAGVFWTAQGMIMMSYPREQEKGMFITIFWVIFNLGGVIGGIVPFVINYHNGGSLSNAAYIAFVVLECAGACLTWMLAPPHKVVRGDGSYVELDSHKQPSVLGQVKGMLRIFASPLTLALLPLAFSSNFYYSYEFSVYNGELFTTRTRGFNNIWYWAAEMASSLAFGALLDSKSMSRRRRAVTALVVITVLCNLCWLFAQRVQSWWLGHPGQAKTRIDYLQSGRATIPILVYVMMGACDALWQNVAFWLLGSLTNDACTSAHYAGIYKSVQSLGAAVAWQLAARKVPFMAQLAVNWALVNLSLPTMYYVALRIKDSNESRSDSGALPTVATDNTESCSTVEKARVRDKVDEMFNSDDSDSTP